MAESEEFIVEDEGEGPSNRRPFLIAVGALLTVFILAAVCSAALLLTRDGNGQSEEIAAIETQNAIVAVTNEAVTATLAAMETIAAMPTDTPTPAPTDTPEPTNTPRPTNTPVVRPADEETAEAETPTVVGTDEDDEADDETADNTPTPIPVNGTDDDSLPETGIGTWGAVLAGLILVGLLFGARRLRAG